MRLPPLGAVVRVVGSTRGQRPTPALHAAVAEAVLRRLDEDPELLLGIAWDGDDAVRPDSFITVALRAVVEGVPAGHLARRVHLVRLSASTSPWPAAGEMAEDLPGRFAAVHSVVARPEAREGPAATLWAGIQGLKQEVDDDEGGTAAALREAFGLSPPLRADAEGRLPHEAYGNAGYGLLALAASRLLRDLFGDLTTLALAGGRITQLEREHGVATTWIQL